MRRDMAAQHPFELFLHEFVPKVEAKAKQLNKAMWILETTGSGDAADLKAELEAERRMLFNDARTYEMLEGWDKDPAITDPLLKRQLNVLKREFKQNIIPKDLIQKIAVAEVALLQSYINFRPTMEGKKLTENEIKEILKKENDPNKRKAAWTASKEVGKVLAPQILALVKLRNQAALKIGYSDYFQMQLDLQEVDSTQLSALLNDLERKSEKGYSETIDKI
jgi:peptidyl-dipeptidase A